MGPGGLVRSEAFVGRSRKVSQWRLAGRYGFKAGAPGFGARVSGCAAWDPAGYLSPRALRTGGKFRAVFARSGCTATSFCRDSSYVASKGNARDEVVGTDENHPIETKLAAGIQIDGGPLLRVRTRNHATLDFVWQRRASDTRQGSFQSPFLEYVGDRN